MQTTVAPADTPWVYLMFLKRTSRATADAENRTIAGQYEAATAQLHLRDGYGLYHLWYMEKRLDEELARASRSELIFSLITWQLRLLPGESPSPEVMRGAAECITKGVRSYDIPTSVDEERFAAIVFDADYDQAATIAFRIKANLQTRLQAGGTWRAGIATFGRDGVDDDALISTAVRRLEDDARAA